MKQFTVRVYQNHRIVNVLDTNNYIEAMRCEEDMKNQWGEGNVWICDNLQELLVG